MIGITTARTDKPFKVDEHRSERRIARVAVQKTLDGDAKALHKSPFGDPWRAPKDGKQMCDPKSKWMRK